jgi:hypothetical protein
MLNIRGKEHSNRVCATGLHFRVLRTSNVCNRSASVVHHTSPQPHKHSSSASKQTMANAHTEFCNCHTNFESSKSSFQLCSGPRAFCMACFPTVQSASRSASSTNDRRLNCKRQHQSTWFCKNAAQNREPLGLPDSSDVLSRLPHELNCKTFQKLTVWHPHIEPKTCGLPYRPKQVLPPLRVRTR